MTRPKGEDEWLLDAITRERVVADTVVRGVRNMQSILREIRDVLQDQNELRRRYDALQDDHIALLTAVARNGIPQPNKGLTGEDACRYPQCSLPSGHTDAHRAKRNGL